MLSFELMNRWLSETSWRFAVASLVLCGACAGQRDREARLVDELLRTRAEARQYEARAAAVEARLSRLERHQLASAQENTNRELRSRLDYLIAQQERSFAAQPGVEATPPLAAADASTPTPSAPFSASDAAALRALVERMRGRPQRFRGPLTREQDSALRVLLTPERELDPENLWAMPTQPAHR